MDHVKGKRAAILVEKLYEDLELWYPALRLREAGATVTIVGPEGGGDVSRRSMAIRRSRTPRPATSRRATSTPSSSPAGTRPTT